MDKDKISKLPSRKEYEIKRLKNYDKKRDLKKKLELETKKLELESKKQKEKKQKEKFFKSLSKVPPEIYEDVLEKLKCVMQKIRAGLLNKLNEYKKSGYINIPGEYLYSLWEELFKGKESLTYPFCDFINLVGNCVCYKSGGYEIKLNFKLSRRSSSDHYGDCERTIYYNKKYISCDGWFKTDGAMEISFILKE